MFTARYGLIPYIKQIAFRLKKVNVQFHRCNDRWKWTRYHIASGILARIQTLNTNKCTEQHCDVMSIGRSSSQESTDLPKLQDPP